MERTLSIDEPIATHEVRGGGGLGLHACEWGNPEGPPIVFIHGWSQSQLCWARQTEGPLAEEFRLVAFDLRGHGMSEKPLDAGAYVDGRLWADDVNAVIEQLELERPVLVGWSYGGYVIADYLTAYGDAAINGIDFVAAAVLRTPTFEHVGPGLLENAGDACGSDLPASIAAMVRFLRACTVRPLSDPDWNAALSWNMVVPSEVRGALFAREIDNDETLSRVSVPVLVSHGLADAIVLPSMSQHIVDVCPMACASWYEGIGHLPFLEDSGRFDRELAEFARNGH
jgi:non-heme chloroperoxidase